MKTALDLLAIATICALVVVAVLVFSTPALPQESGPLGEALERTEKTVTQLNGALRELSGTLDRLNRTLESAPGALFTPVQQDRNAPCAERSNIIGTLEGQYEERLRGVGVVSRQAVAELHFSDAGRTWTIIMTNSEGVSCVMAAGRDWSAVEPPPIGEAL